MPATSPSERARESWARTPDRAARLAPALTARKVYAAERYIQRLIDSAPPLSDEQRARLAALLAPTNTGSAA
ncbi:hypothetical protein [Blastococcus saxobsidens]|uniref:PhiRv1 phage protein n=1 Tax=Blastococcus saxobsidens TaxID=138336 RepID=A0A4V2G1S9_9ACTN|nr:hypothetical protein [Blastococcus saxobsidens]RZU30466.1 hypothetical protein BKA19_0082 [Blastococcus saxobsidens]